MIKNDTIYVVVFFTSLFLLNCSNEKEYELHPVPENIPHYSANHIVIHQNQDFNYNSLNHKGQLLHNYLNNSNNQFKKTIIDNFPDISNTTQVESISTTRFLLVDKTNSLMWEYNLEKQHLTELASFGRGPGSIAMVTDILYPPDEPHLSSGVNMA